MKKAIFLLALFFSSNIFAQCSIIILYGCSSAGKTSISAELGKTLPGKWKVLGIDMFSNQDGTANSQLWMKANRYIKEGFNVIVDTVSSNFLIDKSSDVQQFVVLTYCSPMVTVEHVKKRNSKGKDHDHRTLKKVLRQYCSKYRSVEKKQDFTIDVLHKSDLENISERRALRTMKDEFFRDNRHVVYIASKLYDYDFFVNTGTLSISNCAKKIKDAFAEFQEKEKELK